MRDKLSAIIERLNAKTLTDDDIRFLCCLLQQGVSQDVSQSGKYNVAVADGQAIYVGDRYVGVTIEQIRAIVQELQTLQSVRSAPPIVAEGSGQNLENQHLRKVALDQATLEHVNARVEVIAEIHRAGYLPEIQQDELNRLKQRLQTFSNLNQELQSIVEQGDRLIQAAVTSMQLQIQALKLAGRTLTDTAQIGAIKAEVNCQQAEAQIFNTFVTRLEDSRIGADWIEKNIDMLVTYASKIMLEHYPNPNLSEQTLDDFRFSLKQFLEQVHFSLYWGNYEILDSPDIPLILSYEQYEIAFQSMKQSIPTRLSSEVIQEIKACLDYLIERLRFY